MSAAAVKAGSGNHRQNRFLHAAAFHVIRARSFFSFLCPHENPSAKGHSLFLICLGISVYSALLFAVNRKSRPPRTLSRQADFLLFTADGRLKPACDRNPKGKRLLRFYPVKNALRRMAGEYGAGAGRPVPFIGNGNNPPL